MSKFKTVFTVRLGMIDSCITAEWPEHLTSETVVTLADLRGESPSAFLEKAAPDAAELCKSYNAVTMRARLNMMDGPYVVDSDHPPTDEELLAYWEGENK